MSRESFAAWLRDELQQRGWDQAELARRAQLSTGLISHIITTERGVGPHSARAIARALQVSPEEVFRRADLLPKSSEIVEGSKELAFYYASLNGEDRKHLLLFARALYNAKVDPES